MEPGPSYAYIYVRRLREHYLGTYLLAIGSIYYESAIHPS